MKLFTSISLIVLYKSAGSLIVPTSYGSIEGVEVPGVSNGNLYHVFKKLPFAQPPVGKLRFQKPEIVKKWNGILNGKEYGPACLSNSTISSNYREYMDEDCLHLNIFTSDGCLNSKNCPVVFYIHGGGMAYDSAVMFNDSYLFKNFPSRDIVLVITAFRLGIMSHFIVEDQTVAPTNVGAYDILLALEFMNSEIHNFGGDNKKVTLFGHSYGGATASAFTFSTKIDQEQRLFQRVVSMSPGREFNILEEGLAQTKIFAKRTGCEPPDGLSPRDKEQYMMECLQKIDQFELLRIQRKMEEDGHRELEFMTQREPLFQEGTYPDFFKNPKNIPFITGCVLLEMNNTITEKPIGEIFDYKNPEEVDRKYREDKESGKLKFHITDETLLYKVDVMVRSTALAKIGAPVYVYEYTYPKHAKHTDDLSYLMGIHIFEMDENEEALSEVYPELFLNFVKYGKPATDWDLFNTSVRNYFDINWDVKSGRRPEMRNGFEKEIHDYWFVEMREFDRNTTRFKNSKLSRNGSKLNQRGLEFSSGPMPTNFQSNSVTTCFLFIAVLAFLFGIFIGKYTCRSKNSNLYIRLNGNDYYG